MILVLHNWELVQEYIIWWGKGEECTVSPTFLDALKEAMTGRYDLILVDADSFLGGVGALAQHAKVVGLTSDNTGDMDKKVKIEGGAGAVFIGGKLREITSQLENISKGDPVEWKPIRANHVAELGGVGFGRTQLEVLDGVARGLSSRQIARRLGKEKGYINQVVNRLYQKTGARGRTRLALWVRGVMG